MDSWSFWGTVTATALGGFDPAPALIGTTALGCHIPGRHVVRFGLLLVLGTAAWGVMLTVLVGTRLSEVDWHGLIRGGATAAWIELALGMSLLTYAGYRLRARHGNPTGPKHRSSSATGLYLAAAGFIGIVVFDLPFDILVTAAARQAWWNLGAGWVLWAVISQFPLVLLTTSILLGRHGALVSIMTTIRAQIGPAAHLFVVTVLALMGLFLAVDAVRFLALGQFLVR